MRREDYLALMAERSAEVQSGAVAAPNDFVEPAAQVPAVVAEARANVPVPASTPPPQVVAPVPPVQPLVQPAPTVQVVVAGSQKEPFVAALLGFFFGPLGLLYVGLKPALIMFGVNVVVGIFTLGIGLVLTWPVSAIVGYVTAKNSNERFAQSIRVTSS